MRAVPGALRGIHTAVPTCYALPEASDELRAERLDLNLPKAWNVSKDQHFPSATQVAERLLSLRTLEMYPVVVRSRGAAEAPLLIVSRECRTQSTVQGWHLQPHV